MGRYDYLAVKAYKSNDMKTGMKYEKKSDSLYKKNYKKIWMKK